MSVVDSFEFNIDFKRVANNDLQKTITELESLSKLIQKVSSQISSIPKISVGGKSAGVGSTSSLKEKVAGSAGFSYNPALPPSFYQAIRPPQIGAESGVSSIASSLGTMGSALGVAAVAVTALGAAAYKTYDALMEVTDKMVKTFSERESSLRTYTMLTGSPEEAKKQYFKEAALAQKTELTQTDVRGFSSRLITAGFRGEDLERARLNIADLVTMRPTHLRTASANQLAELYSKVSGAGYVQEGLINRTASRFVQTKLVYDEIAKALNIQPGDVRDALKNRKVSSDVFFSSFQKASMKQLNESKLGEFATLSAGSLGGLLSNLDEAQENLLRTIDPNKIQGVDDYKKSIQGLIDTITAGTKSGDDLRYFLEDVSNIGTSLKSIGLDTTSSFLESFAEGYKDTMLDLGMTSDKTKSGMDELRDGMKLLGKTVGENLGPALAKLIAGFIDVLPEIKKFTEAVIDIGGVVVDVVKTMYDGIKAILPKFDLGIKEMEEKLNGGPTVLKAGGLGALPLKKQTTQFEIYNPNVSTPQVPGHLMTGEEPIHMGGKKRHGGGGGYSDNVPSWSMQAPSYTQAMLGPINPYTYPKIDPYRIPAGEANSLAAMREDKRPVHVDNITINVSGENMSAQELSEEIVLQIQQTFARLQRAPSPSKGM